MKFVSELRSLVFMRRIARALEAQNQLTRERMALEYPSWAAQQDDTSLKRKRSKLVDMGVADTAEWNKRWQEEQENLL